MNWQNPSSALLHSVSLSLQREAGREVLTDGCSVLWLLLQFWMGHHSGKHRERERKKSTQRGQKADHLLFCTDHYTHLSYLQSEHCSQSSFKNTEFLCSNEQLNVLSNTGICSYNATNDFKCTFCPSCPAFPPPFPSLTPYSSQAHKNEKVLLEICTGKQMKSMLDSLS